MTRIILTMLVFLNCILMSCSDLNIVEPPFQNENIIIEELSANIFYHSNASHKDSTMSHEINIKIKLKKSGTIDCAWYECIETNTNGFSCYSFPQDFSLQPLEIEWKLWSPNIIEVGKKVEYALIASVIIDNNNFLDTVKLSTVVRLK